MQVWYTVVTGQTLLSLLIQEWSQRSEKGSGLQLTAVTVTTAGVNPAGVRAEGMQQEPPPDENKVRPQLPPGEGWWNQR